MRSKLKDQLPPGPRGPAAVQLLATWKRPTASLERLRKYGKRVTVQLPFQPPFVILSDPDDIKELFTAPPDAIHPGEGARVLEPILGRNSVILLDEGAHMEQRKLMLPAFHGERMRALAGLMTELTDREVDSWPVGEPVALHPRLQRLTLEIVLRAVFGLDSGPRLDGCATCSPRCSSSARARCRCCRRCSGSLRWSRPQRRVRIADARHRRADLRAGRGAPRRRRRRQRRARRHAGDAARRPARGRLADVRRRRSATS